MALSQEQVNLLAQGLSGSRSRSGLTKVSNTTVQKRPKEEKTKFEPNPSTFQQILNVAGSTAKTIGRVGVGVGKYVGQEIAEIPGEVYRTATNVIPTAVGFGARSEIRELNRNIEAQSKSIDNVFNDYKSGRITKDEYQARLSELNEGQTDIRTRADAVVERTDPMKATEDFTDTALLFATLGLGKAASAVTKPGGAFLGRVLKPNQMKAITKLNIGVENQLRRIPGSYMNQVFARPGQKILGQTALKGTGMGDDIVRRTFTEALKEVSAKDATKYVANKLLIKYPLTYHQIFDDTALILDNISKGDFRGALGIAALDATALISGPIGGVKKFFKKFGLSSKRAVFGTNSLFDELSGRTINGDRSGIGRYVNDLKKTDPKRYEESIRWMKSIQATNLHAARDNVKVAADSIDKWFYHHGIDVSKLTPQEVFESIEKYGKALDSIHKDLGFGIVQGIDKAHAHKVTLGRWDQKTRNAFADQIENAGTKNQAKALLEGAADEQVVWTHNDTLSSRIKQLIEEAADTPEALKDVAKAIRAMDAQKFVGKGWSKESRRLMKEGGYIPIVPKYSVRKYIRPEEAGELVSDAITDAADTFKPLPGLEQAGQALQKVGLNPEDTTMTVNAMMRDNLDDALQSININAPLGVSKGQYVANKLSDYMESLPQFPGRKLPAQDARTLTKKEIAKVLDVNKSVAKEVQRAVLGAYTSLPMTVRGLGDKLVDYAYLANPLQRAYARIQGTFRYSWNPFFRLQEISETEILSQALVGGKTPSFFGVNAVINTMFKKTGKQIDDTVELLDNHGVFSGTLGGEAAQDIVIGRITANITKTQKRSMAGMALKLADQRGVPLQQMLNENVDEIADALRVVVQYPRQGGINSPLARTLNLAFFPTRYNLKVAGLAATSLSKQPPAVQLAVINGLMDAREWLNSNEGIVWQSENQDAIRLFRWITPYGSIESAMNLLSGEAPESIGELGQLGGLPFGVITQMIDSQTDFEVNTPYIDLKTGKVFPEYIPDTTKARAATAIQDLLGSMFTYPGRIIGLPGKGQLMRQGTDSILGTEKSDYRIEIPDDGDFTQTQQKQLEALEEAGIREEKKSPPTYDYVFDGYSWNENGYFIPVDIIEKARTTEPRKAPPKLPVPKKSNVKKKSSSRTPASERIARPIQRR